jgi:hypothetical protein
MPSFIFREEQMHFNKYFYNKFPILLKDYYDKTRNRFAHHTEFAKSGNFLMHKNLGIVIDEKDIISFPDHEFWYSWYFVNLIDKKIQQYFNSNYQTWLNNSGGFPHPFEQTYIDGREEYLSPAPNRILLKINLPYDAEEWFDACSFFVMNALFLLEENAHIDAETFFHAVLNDKDFNNPPNMHETFFAEIIKSMI